MFLLTREVRLAVNAEGDEPSDGIPTNSYGGYPTLRSFGHYLVLRITVAGEPKPHSRYLINIRDIDSAVRTRVIPLLGQRVRAGWMSPPGLMADLHRWLSDTWADVSLHAVELALSPQLAFSVLTSEFPMVRLSQKFEFSAAHRLHNPELSDKDNRKTFGKCNNPSGHGHNYELQVTVRGNPGNLGVLIAVPQFERIVADTVIDRFDHKHLNVDVPEFKDLIPSVENIAQVIYRLLKPALATAGADLASVTVWETPKTWCQYGE